MTSRALAALIDTVHGLRTEVDGLKAPQLGHSSLEDASLAAYTGDQLSAQYGLQYDGTSGVVILSGPVPPTPSWALEGDNALPAGQAVVGGYALRWHGKWVDLPAVPPDTVATPQVAPADFSRVELHASTLPVFAADTFDTMVSSTSSSRGGTWFIKSTDNAARYFCLVARSASGKASARSEIIGPFTAAKDPDATAAQAAADDALAKAGTAESNATVALTTANGKTKAHFSTTNPTVGELTPGAQGDVWYRRDAQGWLRAVYEHMGATGDATTQGWRFRQFTDQVLGSLTAGKITTGTLGAAVKVTVGDPVGNRLEIDGAKGLQGIQRVNGIDVVTFGFDISSGNGALRGDFRTVTMADRAVIVSGDIAAAGGTAAQPGILFRNPTSVNRWAQIYSTNSDLHLDGPAYTDINGVPHLGVSMRYNVDAILGYSASPDGSATFRVGNDDQWWVGYRGTNPGARATVYGSPNQWYLGNGANGTFIQGDHNGNVWLGDKDAAKSRFVMSPTSISVVNGLANTELRMPGTGEWFVGHNVGQAIYSVGNKLCLRDRQVAGDKTSAGIQAFIAPGNWFDVHPSDNGAVHGGMFVHGRFGATIKNFIIDHPVDPERRLVHSSTESPAAGVEYYGMVELDQRGEGIVELPGYFEALTHIEGRAVLLTVVGRPAAVGADEIAAGRFTVYGPPGRKVSWLVKANRKDVEFEVEPLKDGTFAGDAPAAPADSGAEAPPPLPMPDQRRPPQAGGKHGEPV